MRASPRVRRAEAEVARNSSSLAEGAVEMSILAVRQPAHGVRVDYYDLGLL
jgi:hypothetical protein